MIVKEETIVRDYCEHERMTGKENYEILGNLLTKDQVGQLMYACTNTILTADCVKKACITKAHLQDNNWKIAMGAIRVFSKDMLSTYGHDFNPPKELHCWLEKEDKIIDIALPGVIIRGLRACDELGSFLEGRTPVILAGESPDWVIYKTERSL
jgi:hypothetical protein